jgi:hypothetical protein
VRREGRGAGPLVLNLSHVPESDELYLEIDKGDNLPLAVSGVEGSHAAVRLLFKAAPGAPLHLYYGNFGASMPRYDLAAAVPRWESEGVRAVRARLGPEEAMKPLAASSRRWSAGGASWMFWAVLAAVVIGLLVIVARLLPPSGPAGGARNG